MVLLNGIKFSVNIHVHLYIKIQFGWLELIQQYIFNFMNE